MKKIRDWLPDWTMVHSSNKVQRQAGVSELLDREVESEFVAYEQVNRHIDTMILWLDGCRPSFPGDAL